MTIVTSGKILPHCRRNSTWGFGSIARENEKWEEQCLLYTLLGKI